MEINYTLYLAVLLGAVIYAICDYAGKVGTDVLTKKYIIVFFANLIAGVGLVWMTGLKAGIMQIGWFDAAKAIAMLFGITGMKLFKTIIDLADKNVKTKIGINEKTRVK